MFYCLEKQEIVISTAKCLIDMGCRWKYSFYLGELKCQEEVSGLSNISHKKGLFHRWAPNVCNMIGYQIHKIDVKGYDFWKSYIFRVVFHKNLCKGYNFWKSKIFRVVLPSFFFFFFLTLSVYVYGDASFSPGTDTCLGCFLVSPWMSLIPPLVIQVPLPHQSFQG